MFSNRVPFGVSALTCATVLAAAALFADESSATPQGARPQDLLLDDVPAPLVPERPRTELDRDRLEATSLFAAGRTHERREEYVEALRCYQRALRYDPQADAVARAIVSAAVHLKRLPLATRYAEKIAALERCDPLMLRRLGVYLTEEGDWVRAAQFYEKAIAARGHVKESAADILLQMELGRLYYLAEKYKQAADCFAKVSRALDHPDEFSIDGQIQKVLLGEPSDTYVLFGECFLAADRSEEALAAFKKADSFASNPPLLRLGEARVFAKTGKPAEALAALEATLAAHFAGEGAVPYLALADVLKQLGKSEELIPRLEKLYADDAGNAPLANYLAAQYRDAGNVEKAESLYLGLIQRSPSLPAYRRLIDLYRRAKRYDALLTTLGQSIDGVGVLETLGAEGQAISGDADALRGVIDAAQAKRQANPDSLTSGMCQAVALLAVEAKQYDTAAEFFDLALAAKPKNAAELLLAWGVALLIDDRAAEAVKVFQRGIDDSALPKDNPAFHFYLAGALAMSDRTDEAIAAARKAGEMKRDAARFREREAWVLYFAKRYPEAKQAYAKLIEEFDADDAAETRAVLREARLVLANLCVLDNDVPAAESRLEQVLDEFPGDVNAMNDLGYLWADENRNLVRAQRMIQQAVDAEPDNIAYRDSLGWVLFRLGRYPEAVAELEKAVTGKKIDGVVLDHLGDACQKANQPDKALDAWRRAAESLRAEKEIEKAESVEKKIPK